MTKTLTKTESSAKTSKVKTEIENALLTKAENKFNASLKKVNEAIEKKETNAKKLETLKAELATNLDGLNAEIKADEFSKILNCKFPSLEACKKGSIVLTSIKIDKNTQEFSAGTKYEIIDLVELQLFNPNIKITKNPEWAVNIEALNHAILNYNIQVQGIKEKSNRLSKFKISASAAMLNITPDDMSTLGGIKKAIQDCINKIVDGYTVTDANAMQFLLNYTKCGKAINGVSMPTESNFRRLLMRIMYQIVNNSTPIAE